MAAEELLNSISLTPTSVPRLVPVRTHLTPPTSPRAPSRQPSAGRPQSFRLPRPAPESEVQTPETRFRTPSLVFDAGFEGGNLFSAVRNEDCVYTVTVRGDTNAERHRQWFYFRVTGGRPDTTYLFHVVGFSKPRKHFSMGMVPLVRSNSNALWFPLPRSTVFIRNDAKDTKTATGLSFLFKFDSITESYYFTYNWPYTCSMLTRFTAKLTAALQHSQILDTTSLQTIQGLDAAGLTSFLSSCSSSSPCPTTAAAAADAHTIYRITDKTTPDSCKRSVVLTARVHPGEVPSSFVAHGFIEFLVSSHPLALALRRRLVCYVVPMLNPEGVSCGNHRCSTDGRDLNRAWGQGQGAGALEGTLAVLGALRGGGEEREQEQDEMLRNHLIRRHLPGARAGVIEGDIWGNRPEIHNSSIQDAITFLSTLPPGTPPLPALACTHPRPLLQALFSDPCPRPWAPLDLVLDLHSHSRAVGAFFFANPEPHSPAAAAAAPTQTLQAVEAIYPLLAVRRLPILSAVTNQHPFRWSAEPGKDPTLRRVLHRTLKPAPAVYTLEVSNFAGAEPFWPGDLCRIGAGLALALGDWYGIEIE